MIKEAKYVVINCSTGFELPVIIPMAMGHGEMSHEDVISAGFCSIDKDGNVLCYGRSDSLKKSTRGKDDEELIETYLFTRQE